MRLLSPTSTDYFNKMTSNFANPNKTILPDKENIADLPSKHKRNVSNIPQFDDDDADSLGSLSLNSALEQDVIETVQFIVEMVCSEHEIIDAAELNVNEYDPLFSGKEKADISEMHHSSYE